MAQTSFTASLSLVDGLPTLPFPSHANRNNDPGVHHPIHSRKTQDLTALERKWFRLCIYASRKQQTECIDAILDLSRESSLEPPQETSERQVLFDVSWRKKVEDAKWFHAYILGVLYGPLDKVYRSVYNDLSKKGEMHPGFAMDLPNRVPPMARIFDQLDAASSVKAITRDMPLRKISERLETKLGQDSRPLESVTNLIKEWRVNDVSQRRDLCNIFVNKPKKLHDGRAVNEDLAIQNTTKRRLMQQDGPSQNKRQKHDHAPLEEGHVELNNAHVLSRLGGLQVTLTEVSKASEDNQTNLAALSALTRSIEATLKNITQALGVNQGVNVLTGDSREKPQDDSVHMQSEDASSDTRLTTRLQKLEFANRVQEDRLTRTLEEIRSLKRQHEDTSSDQHQNKGLCQPGWMNGVRQDLLD